MIIANGMGVPMVLAAAESLAVAGTGVQAADMQAAGMQSVSAYTATPAPQLLSAGFPVPPVAVAISEKKVSVEEYNGHIEALLQKGIKRVQHYHSDEFSADILRAVFNNYRRMREQEKAGERPHQAITDVIKTVIAKMLELVEKDPRLSNDKGQRAGLQYNINASAGREEMIVDFIERDLAYQHLIGGFRWPDIAETHFPDYLRIAQHSKTEVTPEAFLNEIRANIPSSPEGGMRKIMLAGGDQMEVDFIRRRFGTDTVVTIYEGDPKKAEELKKLYGKVHVVGIAEGRGEATKAAIQRQFGDSAVIVEVNGSASQAKQIEDYFKRIRVESGRISEASKITGTDYDAIFSNFVLPLGTIKILYSALRPDGIVVFQQREKPPVTAGILSLSLAGGFNTVLLQYGMPMITTETASIYSLGVLTAIFKRVEIAEPSGSGARRNRGAVKRVQAPFRAQAVVTSAPADEPASADPSKDFGDLNQALTNFIYLKDSARRDAAIRAVQLLTAHLTDKQFIKLIHQQYGGKRRVFFIHLLKEIGQETGYHFAIRLDDHNEIAGIYLAEQLLT